MNAHPMNDHLRLTRLAVTLISTIGWMACVGCRSTPDRPPLTSELSGQDVTTAQINYQLFDFVTRFSREVERSADQIAGSSYDVRVRRNALLWKLYAIPASCLAMEHSDPLAILVDLWALCAQQTAYFESGAGMDAFGSQQAVAIQAARAIESEISGVAAKLVKPDAFVLARQEIAEWADAHPLEDHLFARGSIITMLADAFPDRPKGIFQTLNTVQGELADFKGRLALHVDALPRQARWQAELLVDEAVGPLVGAQMTNAFRMVALEREAILAAINRQRMETLEVLRAERVAVLQSVSDQRVATLEESRKIMEEMLARTGRMADAQRDAVLQAVSAERKALFAELRAEPMTLRHDVEPLVTSAMDRAFGRVFLLLGVSYVVLLATALSWFALVQKRRRFENGAPV